MKKYISLKGIILELNWYELFLLILCFVMIFLGGYFIGNGIN